MLNMTLGRGEVNIIKWLLHRCNTDGLQEMHLRFFHGADPWMNHRCCSQIPGVKHKACLQQFPPPNEESPPRSLAATLAAHCTALRTFVGEVDDASALGMLPSLTALDVALWLTNVERSVNIAGTERHYVQELLMPAQMEALDSIFPRLPSLKTFCLRPLKHTNSQYHGHALHIRSSSLTSIDLSHAGKDLYIAELDCDSLASIRCSNLTFYGNGLFLLDEDGKAWDAYEAAGRTWNPAKIRATVRDPTYRCKFGGRERVPDRPCTTVDDPEYAEHDWKAEERDRFREVAVPEGCVVSWEDPAITASPGWPLVDVAGALADVMQDSLDARFF